MAQKIFRTALPSLVLLSLLSLVACAKDPVQGVESIAHRDVITGLDTPWEIVWGPDDRLWVTERNGRISRIDPETGEQVVLTTIADVYETSESGLLGMAVDRRNGATTVYVVYTYRDAEEELRERLVRYDYNGTGLTNPRELLAGIPANGNHNGSRLVIVGDKLFMTTGDAQESSSAQDLGSVSGKVLRMNLDGTPPADNPYAGSPSPTNLIWTSGHRNAQGLAYAPNGIMYSSEHGPNSDDEINIIEKGRNYGWPEVEGYCDGGGEKEFCADSNVVEPIKAWTPTLAVCGLEYYGGEAIPAWRGGLLLASLKAGDLRLLRLGSDGRSIVEEKVYGSEEWGRLRDICVSPDGRVFVGTSNRDGRGNPRDGDDRIVEIVADSITAE